MLPYVDLIDFLRENTGRIVIVAVLLVIIFVVYKFLSRLLSRHGERLDLEPHAMNALRLILRVLSIALASSVILAYFQVPSEWFVGGTALVGAFLGFGSSQTINNLVAGLYVLVTQPFKVKDYVRIGDLEGQVEEITINYTNLYTPTFNLLKIPNTQVMNSRILNLTHEGFIKYTFTMSFDHSYTDDALMEKVLKPAIEEFHTRYEEYQLRKPEVYLELANRIERVFLIRIFIPKGQARKLYVMQPELLDMILTKWDTLSGRT